MADSTFKILLTTDNHLGFAERDPRRGDDSYTTFEEVLRAARTEHDVDLMLLGGDLFHENKPSLGCLVRTCSLFRKYVYGNKTIDFSLLSDPAVNFPTHALPMANFQDPNINVALPVFSIHGNHDDPVGGTSSLDLLSTNGYLNYFGHVSSLEDIVVEPVLLRKGNSFIALYGLGNVRDERLHRCFRLKKIQFIHPTPVPGRKWFNILLVHQNRGVRGAGSKNGILESMLRGFGMDLVIWGNEHEQLMMPQPSEGFDVVQPGSTILTSLSALECNPKQYGVLEVRGTSYRLTPYTLRSVRPVVRRTVELRVDLPEGRTLDAVETFLHGVMREMVTEAEEQVNRIPDDVLGFHPNLKYPLMRLAVDFTDVTSAMYPQPNFNRFGQQYMDVVANPGELLRPVKPKPARNVVGTVLGPGGVASFFGALVPTGPPLNTLDIRVRVADVFNHNVKHACTLISEPELSAAVYAFAEKGERDAIDERLAELLHTSQKSVWRRLQSGASDAVLNAERVVEEVVTHKRHVNERYARVAQLEDAVARRSDDEGAEEEVKEEEDDHADGINGKTRHTRDQTVFTNSGTRSLATRGVVEGRRPTDVFEAARVSTHVTASTAVAGTRPVATAYDLEESASGLHRHVSSLVQDALGGEGEEEEDGGEELPEDGLDRVSLDNVIAQAMQPHPPAKRARSSTTPSAGTTPVPQGFAGALPRGGDHRQNTTYSEAHGVEDAGVHDLEEDDAFFTNGSEGGGAVDVDDEDNKDAMEEYRTGMRGGRQARWQSRGAGRGARGGTTTTTASATKRSRTTSARGSGAAKSRATAGAANKNNRDNGQAGGPTLTLIAHQGTTFNSSTTTTTRNVGGAGGGNTNSRGPAPSAAAAGAASNGAMLDLLSKWTGGPPQPR